jgi:hypothetical protein
MVVSKVSCTALALQRTDGANHSTALGLPFHAAVTKQQLKSKPDFSKRYSRNHLWGRNMPGGRASSFGSFICANCNALYQLVRGDAGPETQNRQITCCNCGAPFPAREGKFVLKYFMLRQAAQRVKRRSGVSARRLSRPSTRRRPQLGSKLINFSGLTIRS